MQPQISLLARRVKIGCGVLAAVAASLVSQGGWGQSSSFNPPFPRLASGQIGDWGTYKEERIVNIAKHDVAVIGLWPGWAFGGYNTTTLPQHIKQLNPNIKLANYTIVQEINPTHWPAVDKKISSEQGPNGSDWYLRDSSGNHVSSWPDTYRVNISTLTRADSNGQRFPEWFANYWNNTLSAGPWDGVYSDAQTVDVLVTAAWDGVTNRDAMDPAAIAVHTAGHVAYRNAWAALHPNWMFFANTVDQGRPGQAVPSNYLGLNDGGWFEGLMGVEWSPETWSGWDGMMEWYRNQMAVLKGPRIGMFHNVVENTFGIGEFRWNRYGLASCLMDDGYYMVSVDLGYSEQRWYDEFDVDLGYPVAPPQKQPWSNGVYKREFERGLVLVNPRGNGTKTVNIGAGWRRIRGQQDPVHNNGQLVTSLTLNDADGIILLREGAAPNGTPPKPPSQLSIQ